eukprot:TRINITY_DN8230_c0_g1_i1.p1 TRINITY_DN8230_c0_g1~~TRINITY_DN8230_c0_g1_i1.p1  ORF type:complete len:326 (-),score=66.13 TRINITY_DN8230_c0_g1_i1:497-1474(-)
MSESENSDSDDQLFDYFESKSQDKKSSTNDNKTDTTPSLDQLQKQRVLIIQADLSQIVNPRVEELPLPSDPSILASFVVTEDRLYELQDLRAERDLASWFVDDSVISSPSLFLATPIDEVFLILPLLESSSHFRPLDQIISEDTRYRLFLSRLGSLSTKIKVITDLLHSEDQSEVIGFRLNKDKLLRWLRFKVERTRKELSKKRESCPSGHGAFSPAFSGVRGKIATDDDVLRCAVGIICDYVTPSTRLSLYESYSVKPPEISVITQPPSSSSDAYSNVNTDDRNASEPANKRKATSVLGPTAAHKRLEQTNKKGIKSITSYFKK